MPVLLHQNMQLQPWNELMGVLQGRCSGDVTSPGSATHCMCLSVTAQASRPTMLLQGPCSHHREAGQLQVDIGATGPARTAACASGPACRGQQATPPLPRAPPPSRPLHCPSARLAAAAADTAAAAAAGLETRAPQLQGRDRRQGQNQGVSQSCALPLCVALPPSRPPGVEQKTAATTPCTPSPITLCNISPLKVVRSSPSASAAPARRPSRCTEPEAASCHISARSAPRCAPEASCTGGACMRRMALHQHCATEAKAGIRLTAV